MIGRAEFAVLVIAGLAACDRGPATLAPADMSGAGLNQELQRCRGLGLRTYDDPVCRRAHEERTKRFYVTPSERLP